MLKTTLKIDGMMCGMCESHMNDMIRNKFDVKKVTSNHKTGSTEIISKESISKEKLTEEIKNIGYELVSVEEAEFEQKKFLFFKK